MGSRESPATRARRFADRDVRALIADLRETRIQLGLSQEDVATAAGLSRHAFGRVERFDADHIDVDDLAAIAAVLGLDLRIATYPAGDPLRGLVQPRLLEAFRHRLHVRLGWGSEVPLPIEGDRRAWDATVIADDGWSGIEGISRVGAADSVVRRVQLKQRDDPRIRCAILVVLDSQRNREALRASLSVVRAAFPLGSHEVMAAFAAGRTPSMNGVVLLRLPSGGAGRPHDVHSGGKPVDAGTGQPRTFVDKPIGGRAPGP